MIRPTLAERLLGGLNLFPLPVIDSFGNVMAGMALAAAVRRGVVECLALGPAPAGEIARQTGTHPEAALLLAETLCVLGYARRRGETYQLTRASRKWLLRDSPYCVANLLRYVETRYRRWADIDTALRTGRPSVPYFDEFGPEDREVYAAGMADLAKLLLPAVRRLVKVEAHDKHLVDLGGSHALYAIDCCRRAPGLRATVVDLPGGVGYGRRMAREAGMEERVRFEETDIRSFEPREPADVVLLFNVIHGFDESANRALIARVAGMLRTGGRLYILDQYRGAGGSKGGAAVIPLAVGLNLLNETGGTSYDLDQVRSWAGDGFTFRFRKSGVPGVGLVTLVARP